MISVINVNKLNCIVYCQNIAIDSSLILINLINNHIMFLFFLSFFLSFFLLATRIPCIPLRYFIEHFRGMIKFVGINTNDCIYLLFFFFFFLHF